MTTKKFIRCVEDFQCENCGQYVEGDGYTNHCPKCLWSKHVDIDPGDRMSTCGKMMEPIEVVIKQGMHSITHRCVCGKTILNKVAKNDDFGVLLKL